MDTDFRMEADAAVRRARQAAAAYLALSVLSLAAAVGIVAALLALGRPLEPGLGMAAALAALLLPLPVYGIRTRGNTVRPTRGVVLRMGLVFSAAAVLSEAKANDAFQILAAVGILFCLIEATRARVWELALLAAGLAAAGVDLLLRPGSALGLFVLAATWLLGGASLHARWRRRERALAATEARP